MFRRRIHAPLSSIRIHCLLTHIVFLFLIQQSPEQLLSNSKHNSRNNENNVCNYQGMFCASSNICAAVRSPCTTCEQSHTHSDVTDKACAICDVNTNFLPPYTAFAFYARTPGCECCLLADRKWISFHPICCFFHSLSQYITLHNNHFNIDRHWLRAHYSKTYSAQWFYSVDMFGRTHAHRTCIYKIYTIYNGDNYWIAVNLDSALFCFFFFSQIVPFKNNIRVFSNK